MLEDGSVEDPLMRDPIKEKSSAKKTKASKKVKIENQLPKKRLMSGMPNQVSLTANPSNKRMNLDHNVKMES